MTGSTLIKNSQVNGGNWIDLRAKETTWTQNIFLNIPTTPTKSGIPIHEGDWLGVDNPGIVVNGLINYSNETANTVNFHLLEQLATATGLSWLQEKLFTSGNNPFHPGSIGVFIKDIKSTRRISNPFEMDYNMTLITTSGA